MKNNTHQIQGQPQGPHAWWIKPCTDHGDSSWCFAWLPGGHFDSALCSCKFKKNPDCHVHRWS